MLYAKSISWIDDCRIPTTEILGREQKSTTNYAMLQGGYNGGFWDNTKGLGRFPANILVSDDMLNDGFISKSQDNIRYNKIPQKIYGGGRGIPRNNGYGFNDKGTNSRYYDIDKWFENLLESCE